MTYEQRVAEAMKATHTRGPWHVVDGIVCDNYGQDILGPVIFDAFPDEQQANARLIACAPELLEACEGFTSQWSKCAHLEELDLIEIAARIGAAINKAKGRV